MNDPKKTKNYFRASYFLFIYYVYHSQSTVIKKEKTRNTLVNAERPLGMLQGHCVLYGIYTSFSSTVESLVTGS